jgi:hypothetical protein
MCNSSQERHSAQFNSIAAIMPPVGNNRYKPYNTASSSTVPRGRPQQTKKQTKQHRGRSADNERINVGYLLLRTLQFSYCFRIYDY